MNDTDKITQAEIGRIHGKNQRFISDLKLGLRFTTDRHLALDIAKYYGGLPIEYINPAKRETYLKAYPELGLSGK